jgi:hypothetical protein
MNSTSAPGLVSRTLLSVVGTIPLSAQTASPDPEPRARALAKSAAVRAAALSGTMSLPPGPFGLATVIPDLIAVWRLQQQLVADLAAVFGKSRLLTPEVMTFCLFQHGTPGLAADLVRPAGNRMLIRRVAESTLRQLLGKIAIRVSRRMAAKGFSRWLPVLGAVGVGAYAYYDTAQIAASAMQLFARELVVEPAESSGRPSRPARVRRTATKKRQPALKRRRQPVVKRRRGRAAKSI